MLHNFLKKVSQFFESLLPETEIGDKVIAYKRFIRIHKRIPRNSLLFNDVLFKIKASDEIINPLRVFVSDKEFVKMYVKSVVGDEYNVPTIKILNSYDEVERFSFPENCCIKSTHASGQVIFRKNNEPIDFFKIKSWFGINYYKKTRERNYKTLTPKIIVEPLIFSDCNLTDYRFFCYKGRVKMVTLDIGKYSGYCRAFYDLDWNELPFSLGYPKADKKISRPGNLEEMISVAQRLSEHFNFVRVDIYSNGEKCYVGELTNCHASAGQKFIPVSAEKMASNMIFGP